MNLDNNKQIVEDHIVNNIIENIPQNPTLTNEINTIVLEKSEIDMNINKIASQSAQSNICINSHLNESNAKTQYNDRFIISKNIELDNTYNISNEDLQFEINEPTLIKVHAYDWVIKDEYGDDGNVVIHCWSLDKESQTNLLRFMDFPAFCHVELPMFVSNRYYTWSTPSVNMFTKMLSERLGDNAPIKYIFNNVKKLYYYRGNRRFPMVQLCFNSIKSMQHCVRLLANPLKTDDWGFIKCNVWEDSISIIRKLLTVRNTRYSQWFSVVGQLVEPELRISTLEKEYIAQWETITPIPTEECKGWTTKPKVLAFDIECYSNNHRAMPDKYNALHVAYMISCIYQKYKDSTSRKRYGIIIGECNHIPNDKLNNCEIIKVNNEYEMVEAMNRVIHETDPDIITGYNILGFDYPYLDHRVRRILKQWPSMGRIIGERSYMTSKTWQSGAYGHQSINILQMEGRISIDALPIVKRDYKLEKYDLNTVCKLFIGKSKHDVSAPEMFLIYEDMRNTLTLLVSLLRELQNNPQLSNNNDFIKQLSNAQEAFDKAKIETTRVLEYCIQDSELVIDLIEKLNIWEGLVEMSNIVGTTIVDLFTRGQQLRCLSQLYDLAARSGFVLDDRDVPGFGFAGGFVYEPIPGLYNNIICLDFASLYPSIMMAYNICYTTLIPPELENEIPDELCNIIEFDQDETDGSNTDDESGDDDEEALTEINTTKKKSKKKVKTIKRHYRFKFYKGDKHAPYEGLLPKLVKQLVTERRAVNKLIVQTKDEQKSYEKTEDLRIALNLYLNNNGEKIDPTIALRKLNDLNSQQPPAHPLLIKYCELELKIAELQHVNNRDELLIELSKLNNSHDEISKSIESCKILIIVLDKRQLAIKVSANSFFGFLGVKKGKKPLIEGAMSITAKGRELISLVREYIEKTYGGIQVYGDTDSVMMDLNIKDSKQCNYWGLRLAQEISGIKPGEKDCDGKIWPEGRLGLFPPPLAMEFEKAMRLLCLKKKKYAAYFINKDGNFKMEEIKDRNGNVIDSKIFMLKKGIVLARRDNCKFLRNTYTEILDMIMSGGELDAAIDILVNSIQNLLDGKVPYEDLVIIRELGANYKSENFFMKVFSDELKKSGKIVNPGDRLDFVIVENPNATLLGHKMRLTEQYIEKLNSPNPEHIDYNYYIEKVLMNPINQLFQVGFKDVISKLNNIFFRPTNRHKPIYLDRPVQIILKRRQYGHNINDLKIAVRNGLMNLKSVKSLVLITRHPQNLQQSQILQPPIISKPPNLSPHFTNCKIPQKSLTLCVIPLTSTKIQNPQITPPSSPILIMPPIAIKSPPKITRCLSTGLSNIPVDNNKFIGLKDFYQNNQRFIEDSSGNNKFVEATNRPAASLLLPKISLHITQVN